MEPTPRRPASAFWLPSVALVLAALIGAGGLLQSRRADRYVTVKGVAEREVEADQVVWPMAVSVTANDLGTAQDALAAHLARVRAHLEGFGVASTEVTLQGTQVTDRVADRYSRLEPGQLRYILTTTLSVRSDNLDAVEAAYRDVGTLIGAGVPLAVPGGYGELRPTWVFSGLNAVKPEMIAAATASAREAAERFAEDSGSELGQIRRADQGVFQILSRTPGTAEAFERYKQVRVVSTVQYFLDG
jgi:hypothetical protein